MKRPADFEGFVHLRFDRPSPGVLVITLDRPESANRINVPLHQDLGRVWLKVSADDETRAVVLTGSGEHFCLGGDPVDREVATFQRAEELLDEILDIAANMRGCRKPVVAAVNGNALAGGAALALLADVSVMAEDAWLADGHVRAGLVAGDHAALVWPTLCSLSKARYYLLTGDRVTGHEAERIGLVTFAVPAEDVMPRALSIAEKLAAQPEFAVRWTKRALDLWAAQHGSAFEASAALEVLSFFGPAFGRHNSGELRNE